MTPADLRKRIEEKISAGRIHMRPRWHFVLQTTVRITIVMLAGLAAIYLASFILFTLRASGVSALTGFGWRGVAAYLGSLPWLIIIVTLGLLYLLEIGIHRFGIGYRRPIAYTLLGMLMALAVGGVMLTKTSLHTRWDVSAANQHLPIFGGLYRGFGPRSQHAATVGTITSIRPNEFTLQSDDGTTYTVLYDTDTRLPQPETLAIGEHVIVGGDVKGTMIAAFGIRPTQGNWQPGRGFRRGQ